MIDYSKLQTAAKTLLQNFGAVPLTVQLLNGTQISTIGVFSGGLAKNIDTQQSPTSLTGETSRMVIVPGIDFYGAVTPGVTTTPQVSGLVIWYIGITRYAKDISTVEMEMPLPNVPILFTLGIE